MHSKTLFSFSEFHMCMCDLRHQTFAFFRAHTSLPANVASVAEKRLPLLLNHVTGLSYSKMEKVAANIRRMKRYYDA